MSPRFPFALLRASPSAWLNNGFGSPFAMTIFFCHYEDFAKIRNNLKKERRLTPLEIFCFTSKIFYHKFNCFIIEFLTGLKPATTFWTGDLVTGDLYLLQLTVKVRLGTLSRWGFATSGHTRGMSRVGLSLFFFPYQPING